MFDTERLISDRLRAIDASGIRRVFDLAANLEDPVNLSIGQPDFDVPQSLKDAACQAIQDGFNRYTQTQGIAELRTRIVQHMQLELPQTYSSGGTLPDHTDLLITSGVSGGLVLALLSCLEPGDEVLVPDPYFVMYRHLITLTGATPIYVDTYPDFQLQPDQLEKLITPRTKMLLFNSPGNPTGAIASETTCRDIAELADRHGLLLVSDEIYDQFCYETVQDESGRPRCPSPAAFTEHALVLRGFSKTYGMTGWRLGYAIGPQPVIEQMTKLQQYSFVCAPSMVQIAGARALDLDMSQAVAEFRSRRDRVVDSLAADYELVPPGGAFYAFVKVPEHLGLTASQFVERAAQRGLLIIPGSVFSQRDTHFRMSYACDQATLQRGLDLLVDLARN